MKTFAIYTDADLDAVLDRIDDLERHTTANDPLNDRCPFAEGERVRLVRPIPGANRDGVEVGSEGIVRPGFAGIPCVWFLEAPGFGMMSAEGIWITDLCEKVGEGG